MIMLFVIRKPIFLRVNVVHPNFLIIGFINKFEKFDKNKKTIKSQYSLYYPKDSQIISVNYAGDNKLLLRYQLDGENNLILIDLLNEKIITQINFNKSNEWKIE